MAPYLPAELVLGISEYAADTRDYSMLAKICRLMEFWLPFGVYDICTGTILINELEQLSSCVWYVLDYPIFAAQAEELLYTDSTWPPTMEEYDAAKRVIRDNLEVFESALHRLHLFETVQKTQMSRLLQGQVFVQVQLLLAHCVNLKKLSITGSFLQYIPNETMLTSSPNKNN